MTEGRPTANDAPGAYKRGAAGAPFSCDWIEYSPDTDAYRERTVTSPSSMHRSDVVEPATWINVHGNKNRELLQVLEEDFGLHPLALEDVVKSRSRPKADAYGTHVFIALRQPSETQSTEQVGMFLMDNIVITIQEHEGDVFEDVRRRLREPGSRIRSRGTDYLSYTLIDAAIDAYFPVIDKIIRDLAQLEARIIEDASEEQSREIHELRTKAMELKRVVSPMRELVHHLLRGDIVDVTDATRIFLKDAQDHLLMLLDSIEDAVSIAQSLRELHLAEQSRRMNDVMKLLTVISTIFMPLSFMVGLYGMNFNAEASDWNMPELNSPIGYPILLLTMLLLTGLMLAAFWKIGWFGRRRK